MPSRRHSYVAGAPTFPSKSMARTEKVCSPTSSSERPHSKPPRFMSAADSKPHGSYDQKSTLHSNVTSGSFEWNVKIASGSHVSAGGFRSMNDSGGSFAARASYLQLNLAGVESARPAPFRSIART